MGDAANTPSCGIETAELRPLGHGITARRGIVVVVVVDEVVVVGGTVVVVVVEPAGTVVVVEVGGIVVVVVVEAAADLDEKAPAGSTTISDVASTLVSEMSNTPRRRFHKALTASWYWRDGGGTDRRTVVDPTGARTGPKVHVG